MRDIPEYFGLDVDSIALGKSELKGQHYVHFEGYDEDESGSCFYWLRNHSPCKSILILFFSLSISFT
jgi:hypothetical protein